MDKFVIKIPKTSTEPTPSSSETTVSTTEDSSSRPKDVGQKKGRTFQAGWKGKYAWIVYDAAKNKVFCEVCTAAKNMGAPLPSTTHDQESLQRFCTGWYFELAQSTGEISNSRKVQSA